MSQRGLRKRSGDETAAEEAEPLGAAAWLGGSNSCRSLSLSALQMMECLKEQKKQLSQRCHQRIFRLQEVEMSDPELDYQLMRVCKQMIKVLEQKS